MGLWMWQKGRGEGFQDMEPGDIQGLTDTTSEELSNWWCSAFD